MAFFRILAERLLLLLFSITRTALVVQGFSMLTAFAAASKLAPADSPPWLTAALHSSQLVSATLLATGVVLVVLRRLPATRREPAAADRWNDAGNSTWANLLGLSLVVLPALTFVRATDLLSLWREISAQLDQVGFWEALQRPDPFGGILLLPILAALFVPLLESAAVFFLTVVPVVLLILLPTRSRLFPSLFAMTAACQVGLVISGLLAADAFSGLGTEAAAAMHTEPDAEVQQATAALLRAQTVLWSTAVALVAPAIGYLMWVPFLLRSQPVGAFFVAGADATLPPSVPTASTTA